MKSEEFKKDFVKIVGESSSRKECIEKLGWEDATCSYNRLLRWAKRLDVSLDHMQDKRKFNQYNKQMLEEIVKTSISYAECLRKLNLIAAGGNYKHLQRNIDKYKLDISHMKHNAHNQGKELKTFDELVTNDSIKKRLIIERGHECESCNLAHWLGFLITLELEHVDGNNRNNDRSNLKLLCPNCHSQTKTWKGRNIGKN